MAETEESKKNTPEERNMNKGDKIMKGKIRNRD